jgi:hypothetical protein
MPIGIQRFFTIQATCGQDRSCNLTKGHYMKIIALFSLLTCASLSWSAFADEQGPANAKYSSMKEKCRVMGERHGLSGGKMMSWMDRCMAMAKLPKDDIDSKGMSMDDMGGMDGMKDQKDRVRQKAE